MGTEGRQPRDAPPPGDTAESEDIRLVQCWQSASGEQEREDIFRALFERHRGPVLRYFSQRGVAPDQAQDLTQETFLRAYRHLADFRTESRFGTWLFQIALNVHKNVLRERSAQKRGRLEASLDAIDLPAQSALQDPAREPQPVLAQLLDAEQKRLLRAAIQNLPPQMRRCLELRLFLDLKYRDIADVLQISLETVKAHLHQAKQRLRGELGSYFSDIEL